eukprot:CAMPEP_0113544230 /NCGR_PEP_ID=MMETSP0015_2-20120614/10595_1 /TAXON_ID=2838 /ORGANISM="Odontella" /LENGTH=487 /DNA_ID=CAMNT_0000444471 /DNA_START=291 /DNA_END=1754 /DNA_ORIENTATION=- /assembly_acc=CAM_ASM_000160
MSPASRIGTSCFAHALLIPKCQWNHQRRQLAVSPRHRPRPWCLEVSRSKEGEENSLVAMQPVSNRASDVTPEDDTAKLDTDTKQKPWPKKPAKRKNFRMKIFSTLNLPIVEVFSALAVLLSSLLVALGTLNDLPPEFVVVIKDALVTLDIMFAVDFFVRWYAAGQFKAIYLTKPFIVIDLVVVILPLVLGLIVPLLNSVDLIGEGGGTFLLGLQNSAGLQNLLLLRVLRLRRVLTDINTFRNFVTALGLKPQDVRPYQLQLARVLLSVFTLLSVASGLIYATEHDVNPDIPDYFAALYFGLTTLTTVGFGDISPVTSQGRLVVCGSILAGVAIIPAQAAKLVDAIIGFQMDQEMNGGIRRASGDTAPGFRLGRPRQMATTRAAATATDGRGPSGKPIDTPLKESLETPSLRRDKGELMVSGLTCSQCGVYPHRADASFCWSCGAALNKKILVDLAFLLEEVEFLTQWAWHDKAVSVNSALISNQSAG